MSGLKLRAHLASKCCSQQQQFSDAAAKSAPLERQNCVKFAADFSCLPLAAAT
jgi:hypothetical protein